MIMKIAIIGGGNVGRTLGVKLDILSHDVTVVESNLPESIHIDKYIMYNLTGDFGEHSHLVKVLNEIEEMDDDYDIIFVCTKLFDGTGVLRRIRDRIKDDGAIVTIQNMFWVDRVSSLIEPKNSVFMQMDFSCYTINDKTIVIDRDGIKLGIVSKDAFDAMQKVTEVLFI
jgi:ketopantoate reductase